MTARPDFTVLGAGGTIGGALTAALRRQGYRVQAVTRATLAATLAARRPAGHVIDCIGLTGDFRRRPGDAAEAHVGITARCLATLECASFLFLSSTRVYARASVTHEDAPLPCLPTDPSDLYNLTKLAGEALCLSDPRPTVRVARLSNVYAAEPGADTFLGQILREGRETGQVRLRQSPGSAKDYVSLDAVARLLPLIAAHGHHRLYNVAAGANTTHAAIAGILRRVGWRVDFAPDAPTVRFPPIEIARIRQEFGAALSDLSEDLSTIAAGQEVPCSLSTRQAVA